MDSIWLWPLALVAFLFAWPALRVLAARLTADRFPSQALGAAPERISLVRVAEPRWRNAKPRESAERQLAEAGFVEAGAYSVREMAELTLALYANPAARAYAVLYDHPHSGFWAEFVTRYQDGTLANYTSLEPMHADVPEGSVHVAAPELSLAELWKRMLAERPERAMRECSRSAAASDFERGYAESVAHHRQRSVAPEAREGGLEQVA